MIFVDKPLVSDFLKDTIARHRLPVVQTPIAIELGFRDGANLLSEDGAIEYARAAEDLTIYTTSENAIGWIAEHLSFTGLPEKIDLFKNKVKFRTMIAPMEPDFRFREVRLDQLRDLPVDQLPLPLVIKPSVGFFSMGVHKVDDAREWRRTIDAIHAEIRAAGDIYPVEVFDAASFIIEQCIDGDEFAIDAYFDRDGKPVILNIMNHVFASDHDVSDRVYMTSKAIIEANLAEFTAFLTEIGALAGVKNFPVHVELRREAGGRLLPIEINPMRFGGWCTSPDLAHHAYGFNPYVYYQSHQVPDWDELLRGKDGKVYAVVILDNSTGVDGDRIAAFDYDRLVATFEKPLEVRRTDFHEYPVFGFVFTETRADNLAELERALVSDLREYVTTIPLDKAG